MKITKSQLTRALVVPAVGVASVLAVAAPAHAAASGNVPATATLTAGSLSITPNAAIGFSGTLNGNNLSLTDTTAADQTMTTTDATGSGKGWDVTAESATPFTATVGSNTYTLPASALTLNGSVGNGATAAATTAPTGACATGSTCTVANNSAITYPVGIPSNGTGAKIYDAAANTGMGVETESNLGWWLAVPGNTQAGNYSTTVVVAINSGP